nr:reverse transcriptase domain-containing protein [Tanacetum cinerariifolium]
MADQRTMAQLLQAPTEGYEDAIIVLAITADNFELKHGLLTLVQNKQFFKHDKEDPHAHVRYFNKITSTLKFLNVPNTFMLFPFSFEELHQLDTFYNALNSKDQDSLNSVAGGNFLDKMPRECLGIIESKSKAPAYQAPAPQTHGVSKEDFSAYVKANDAVMRNMKTQGQNMQNQLTNLIDLMTKFVNSNTACTSNSGTLPSNKISNPRSDLKAITTRSGVSYDGPQIPPPPSSLPLVVENEPEATKDTADPTNNENTEDVQPQAIHPKPVTSLISKPAITPVSMVECLALADLDGSINLMPYSVWKRLSLSELTPTCMTLELADRSITSPVGIAEDVYIKEAITFNLDQTSRYSSNYSDMTAKRIDVIDVACEEYSQEVLGFFDTISSGNPTSFYDPIVSTTSPTLTPFENSDFLLEEVDAFLAVEDEPTSSEFYQPYLDPEGDILFLEAFLNDDPSPPPYQENYMPEVRKELKTCEAHSKKSPVDEPHMAKLKELPPHLEYTFLEGDDKLPVIIAKDLSNFLDKMPRECLGIIESKSKVRYLRNKPVVARVSTTASASSISPDVAELKDMVRALLLDKKGQSPAPMKAVEESCVTCEGAHSYRNCPATDGNNYRDNIQEFVSQASAVNFNQGNTDYRPPMMSNYIRPPGFPPVPNNQNLHRNNQNRFIPNQNQNQDNNFHQGPVYQPPVFQPPAYQAPVYQAPAPQTQGVSKEDFSAYVKANDAVMRNMQTQGQNMQNQLTNLTDLMTKFVNSNTASTLNSAQPHWENNPGKLFAAPDSLIRSSSRLTRDQTSNLTSATNTTPKCRNHRSSKQKVENYNLEEHLPHVVTMADNRTMAELLRAPTEGTIGIITSVGAARRWLEKVPSCSITTWEDLLSKFINEFFPSSRTTSLRNEISNFQQKFDESFHEAWDRYKDLLHACPHHGFTKLHQLDTIYNALNPTDQDSLNAATGGISLERSTQDVLTIIENKSKQTSVVTTAMKAMLKQFQATPPPALVKAIEEICVTCRGAHPYYKWLAADDNTFLEFRDNIQGYVSAAAVNYYQGSESLPSNTISNPKGELKAIATRSGLVTDGPTVPTPPKSITPEVDELVEETYTDPDLAEYTIKVPPLLKMLKALLSNKEKLQELANTPFNENFLAVILNKLPKKLGDPGKFLVQCGFSELKCKALADLGAIINLIPLSLWKELGLPELIPTHMTLELANRAICTPVGISRDVFIPVGKFTFPADFVIVNYESDSRVPLILGRPFLRTARTLIDVHGEEMNLRDGDERLALNMYHDTSSYSNQPQRESVNLIYIFNVLSEYFLEVLFSNHPSGNPTFSPHQELTSPKVTNDIFDSEGCNVLSEKLPDLNYIKDLHPPLDDNLLSGSTTYSSNSFLEEFTDELALITYPPEYDDNL